ncbi:MAG: protein DA1 [Lentisphaerae bacterium]|nr:protein DA1 [Lentisphaerota bacterium]
MRWIHLFLILFILIPAGYSASECIQCNKKIRGKYIRTRDGYFCSKKCYHASLPECDYCREPCSSRSVTMMGKTFCSKACLFKVFRCSTCRTGLMQVITVTDMRGGEKYFCQKCSKKNYCYFCSMPGCLKQLPDGRWLCAKCNKMAVRKPADVERIFRKVRADLAARFGYDSKHRIELLQVSPARLEKESGSIYQPAGSSRMALMRYRNKVTVKILPNGKKEKRISDEKCQIFVLNTVPEDMLYDALAHELTHDYLRHNVGNVKNLANEEGFCELVSALYNEKNGTAYLNDVKKSRKDPVYGDGYRKMDSLFRKNKSFQKTLKYVK